MSTHRKRLGAWGEEMAAQFLIKNDYQIVERNYRRARGELDIIAKKGDMLVFVEVKTASTAAMGDPATWVTARKQKQIAQVAERFLYERGIIDQDCRFDVIGVSKSCQDYTIQHFENAFWLGQND